MTESQHQEKLSLIKVLFKDLVEREMEKVVAEEMESLHRRVQKRSREIVASAMLDIESRFTMERMGDTMRFEVNLKIEDDIKTI